MQTEEAALCSSGLQFGFPSSILDPSGIFQACYIAFLLCVLLLLSFSISLPFILASLLSGSSSFRAFALLSVWKPLPTDTHLFCSPSSFRFWLIDILVKLSLTFLLRIAVRSPGPRPLAVPCFSLQHLSPSALPCVLLGWKLIFVHGYIPMSRSVPGIYLEIQ